MGNFGTDRRVTGSSGRYEAELSENWRVWGPAGGYVAAITLLGPQTMAAPVMS